MADKSQDIKTRLLATFRVEADEHLRAMTTNLLALDRGLPPAEAARLAEATFREVHTLKGAARSVGLTRVETVCQELESLLSAVTRGQAPLSRPVLAQLHDGIDAVARLLGRAEPPPAPAAGAPAVSGGHPEPAPRAAAPPRPAGSAIPSADTVRLATAALDALLLQAEELLVPKLAGGERVREARALLDRLGRCRDAATRGSAGTDGALAGEIRDVEAAARDLLGRLVRDQRATSGAVDGLFDGLRRIRLTPASTVLDLFPRMVRDVASEHGKEVEWVAHGADLEMDRKVLEAMKEPLIHLVRNAIDHGIERPEVRAEAGKPRRGRIAVSVAALEGNRIEIRVEDDGRGIDVAQVRAAAVRTRLLAPEEAQALPDDAALQLIYRSGLSTSPIITRISGHGLGLVIVKEQVERLGGRIEVETRPGAGTTLRMALPATVATFRGLLVRAGGQRFLLPIESVERVIHVRPDEVSRVDGGEAVRWERHALPAARLGALLGLPEPEDQPERIERQPCAVVASGEARAGLLVDEVLGDQEVLVKELRPPLVRVRHVAAAGLLATGQVVLILRQADLLASARTVSRRTAPRAVPKRETRRPVILVVDDSITTRTMEKNLLEVAGYQVRVAADGLDAWTALRSETVDLVLSDVDMPRMDGFELTTRIRAERGLADLPVVLVTALESREHKERGIEVGANAYVVKSSFDQSNLLEIIRRLT